ncbi:MAG: type II toxin-antitoxin system HicA family toxin [Tannerella sp.]|jgi:predicted RNA binding protein YcfA (HicA-like mRNA interferase family)|nr:type II toxin-antitoxin system HicA family toxin [Tannerella sp.]
MKRLKVTQYLESNNCVFLREGSSHSIYMNILTGKKTSIPRHADIDEITVQKICKQLEIPQI